MRNFILFLTALFVLSGCSVTKPLEFVSVENIQFSNNQTNNSKQITAEVTLFNPNSFKLTVHNADIDVYIEGVNVGKLQLPQEVQVESKSEFEGVFVIELKVVNIFLAGGNILKKIKTRQFNVRLSGTVDAKVLWMNKVFVVEHTEKIKL